jgi:hypothetical protein
MEMDYEEAIACVLDDASRIKLRGSRLDVVTRVRRDFAKQDYCDYQLVAKIEEALRRKLMQWSETQKRDICKSLPLSADSPTSEDFDDYTEGSIDMHLEGELMYLITERLSPPEPKKRRDEDEFYDEDA